MLIHFYLGERKEVRIQVISTRGGQFLIQSAVFELMTDSGVLEDSGPAQLEGAEVFVIVSPQLPGLYTCWLNYTIAGENLKAPVTIEVV